MLDRHVLARKMALADAQRRKEEEEKNGSSASSTPSQQTQAADPYLRWSTYVQNALATDNAQTTALRNFMAPSAQVARANSFHGQSRNASNPNTHPDTSVLYNPYAEGTVLYDVFESMRKGTETSFNVRSALDQIDSYNAYLKMGINDANLAIASRNDVHNQVLEAVNRGQAAAPVAYDDYRARNAGKGYKAFGGQAGDVHEYGLAYEGVRAAQAVKQNRSEGKLDNEETLRAGNYGALSDQYLSNMAAQIGNYLAGLDDQINSGSLYDQEFFQRMSVNDLMGEGYSASDLYDYARAMFPGENWSTADFDENGDPEKIARVTEAVNADIADMRAGKGGKVLNAYDAVKGERKVAQSILDGVNGEMANRAKLTALSKHYTQGGNDPDYASMVDVDEKGTDIVSKMLYMNLHNQQRDNWNDEENAWMQDIAAQMGGRLSFNDYSGEGYNLMTPDEVALVNRVWNSTHDPVKTQEVFDALSGELRARKAEYDANSWAYYADRYGSLTTDLLSIPMQAWANIEGVGNAVQGLFGNQDVKDVNSDEWGTQRGVNAIRGWTGQQAYNSGGAVAKFAHDAGLAVGDEAMKFLPSLVGGSIAQQAASAIAGMAQGTYGAYERGVDNAWLAAGEGLMNAGIEAFTENVGLDAPGSNYMRGGKHWLQQIAAEAGEEGLSEILNKAGGEMLADATGTLSANDQAYIDAIKNSTEKDQTKRHMLAKQAVADQNIEDVLYSTAMGGVVGGALSAPSSIGLSNQQRKQGKSISRNNNANALLDVAMAMDEGSDARQMAETFKAQADKGKKLSNGQLGRLYAATAAHLDEKSAAVVTEAMNDAIVDQMVEKGDSEEVARRAAPILAKQLRGETLTKADTQALVESETATTMMEELNKFTEGGAEDGPKAGLFKRTGKGAQATPEQIKAAEDMLLEKDEHAKVAKRAAPLLARMANGDTLTKSEQAFVEQTTGSAEIVENLRGAETKRKNALKPTWYDDVVHNADAYARKGMIDVATKQQSLADTTRPSNATAIAKSADKAKTLTVKEGAAEDGVRDTTAVPLGSKESVDIQKIEADKDGVLKLVTVDSEGKESKTSYQTLSFRGQSVGHVVTHAVDNYAGNAEMANLMYQGYTGGDSTQYIAEMDAAYRAGFDATTVDKDAVTKYKGMAKEAFALGQKQAQEAEQNRLSNIGKVKLGKGRVAIPATVNERKLSKTQKNQIAVVRRIAEATGINFTFFQSEADATGMYTAENGSYDASTNSIRLDLNAGKNFKGDPAEYAILRTAAHEMTHFIEANSGENYVKMRQFIADELARKGLNFNTLVQEKIDRSPVPLTRGGAIAEVVADGCEMMLKDSEAIQRLMQKDASLGEQVKNVLKEFVNRIRKAFENINPSSTEAKALMDEMDGVLKYADELLKLWDAGLEEAVEATRGDEKNDATSNGAPQLSPRDNAYLRAVRDGDMATAQRMVDEAAMAAGYTIHAYHGTRRADRVGNVFRPDRATSGPMAFFTDNPDIAAHYARDKADTSLAYDEEYADYYSQFRVNKGGKSVKVQDLWRSLPYAERQRIKEAGKHITWDEDMENIVWDDDATRGIGNWDAYTLNAHKGNAIEALIDTWLESGELYGREGDFIQVLELAGINGVEYRDPDARHEKVYDVYLRINNPFNTDMVNEQFVRGFEQWYKQQQEGKYERNSANADQWDKNSVTAERFAKRLRDDISDGTTYAWTSVPDSATDYLKSLGHDGIQDRGGKNGGDLHTVWIPFTSEQVKDASPVTYDDNGEVVPLDERFNTTNNDIRYSPRSSKEKQLLSKEEYARLRSNWNDYRYRGYQFVKRPNGGIVVDMHHVLVYTDSNGEPEFAIDIQASNLFDNNDVIQIMMICEEVGIPHESQQELLESYFGATGARFRYAGERRSPEGQNGGRARQNARGMGKGDPAEVSSEEVRYQAEEFSDAHTQFSVRTKEPPKKVGIAYKVFYQKNGKLYPPMVANPGGADTPVGVWLDADIGVSAPPSKTGRLQVKAGGKGTQGGSGSLAFRPGWHLGDIPKATQFDRKNPANGVKELFPKDFVWAECEYAMDVDYQEEAMSYGYTENGKFRHSYAGLPRLPEDGYYHYRTNPDPKTVPWVITGAMKVTRILSREDVDAILAENGVEPTKWQGENGEMELTGVGGNVQYSPRNSNDPEVTSIKDQLRKAQAELNNMAVVASVAAPDMTGWSKKKQKTWVLDNLKYTGYKVDVMDFGVIEFGEKQIDTSLDYLKREEEVAAFLALPKVLKRGMQVAGHDNHKGRQFDTVTFAAPVSINGVRGNMAVVVKKLGRNLYKTHRILMPDGSSFSYEDKKMQRRNLADGIPSETMAQVPRHNSADFSIQQRSGTVNENLKYSLRTPAPATTRDYLLSLNEESLSTDGERDALKRYRRLVDELRLLEEKRVEQQDIAATATGNEKYKAQSRADILTAQIDRVNTELEKRERTNVFRPMVAEAKAVLGANRQLDIGRPVEQVVEQLGQRMQEALGQTEAGLATMDAKLRAATAKVDKLNKSVTAAAAKALFAPGDITQRVQAIKHVHGNAMGSTELGNRLALMYATYWSDLDGSGPSKALDMAQELAREIVSRSKGHTQSWTLNAIRENLGTFSLNDKQMQELHHAGYNISSLRNVLAGVAKYSPNGTTLDSKWEELCAAVPSLDPSASDGDQITALIDLISREKQTERGFDHASAEQVEAELLASLLDMPTPQKAKGTGTGNVRAIKAAAADSESILRELEDAAAKASNALRSAKSAALNADRITDEAQKAVEYYQALYEKQTAQMGTAIRRAEEKLLRFREKVQADRESREKITASRRRVTKMVKYLDTLRRKESDYKHVPEDLKPVVNHLVSTFAEHSSMVFDSKQAERLVSAYSKLQALDSDLAELYDEDIKERIEYIADLMEQKSGKPMTLAEMHIIEDVVSNIYTMVREANETFFDGQMADIAQIAADVAEEMKEREDKRYRVNSKLEDSLDKLIRDGNLTPVYYFDNLGNSMLKSLGYDILAGQDKYGLYQRDDRASMGEIRKQYNYNSWRNDKPIVYNGVQFTKEQVLWVYATAKREATNELAQTHHLDEGGIVFEGSEYVGEDGKKHQRTVPMRLSAKDVQAITNTLTAEQKGYADAVVQHLSTAVGERGNEVSMRMYGFRKYREQYYFPYKTAGDQRHQTSVSNAVSATNDARLKHQSFSNPLKKGANTPLVLGDFTAMATSHMNAMNTYAAMVIPVENMNRVLNRKTDVDGNTTTIRGLMAQKYGDSTKRYLETLLKDLNGGAQVDNRSGGMIDKMVGLYKKGAVVASASVVLQQWTSIFRAAYMIDPKYLAKGAIQKGDWDELTKYSGVATIKDMGRFDVSVGVGGSNWLAADADDFNTWEKAKQMMNPRDWETFKTRWDDAVNFLPGWADRVTWARIWNAVKAEQADLNPGADTNSDAFLKQCAERFNDIINHTQVYDSTMTRSQLMRSKNALDKMATAFGSEPTVILNMVYDAIRNPEHKGKRKRMIAKGLTVVTLSQLMAAAMQALAGAWRKDDDERKALEKFLDKWSYNFVDNMNPFTMFPYLRDVWDTLTSNYDVERADMSLFSELKDAISKLSNDTYSPYRKVEELVGTLAKFAGIPLKNIMRDLRSTYNAVVNTDWSLPEASAISYTLLDNLPFRDSSKTAYYQRMENAYASGAADRAEDIAQYLEGKGTTADAVGDKMSGMLKSMLAAGNDAAVDAILADMKERGRERDGGDLRKIINDLYKDGEITWQQAERLYKKHTTLTDANDLYWHKQDLDYKGEGNYSAYRAAREALLAGDKKTYLAEKSKLLTHGKQGKNVMAETVTELKDELLALYETDPVAARQLRDMIVWAYMECGKTKQSANKIIDGWFQAK